MPSFRSSEGLGLDFNAANAFLVQASSTETDTSSSSPVAGEKKKNTMCLLQDPQDEFDLGSQSTIVNHQMFVNGASRNFFELCRKEILDDSELNNERFPMKLMIVLSTKDYGHIISWTEEGDKFTIHNLKALVDQILPIHFQRCKFSSLLRKLYKWGFVKHPNKCNGENASSTFFHPKFKKGNLELCDAMSSKSITDHMAEAMQNCGKFVFDLPCGEFMSYLPSAGILSDHQTKLENQHFSSPPEATAPPDMAMAQNKNAFDNSYENRKTPITDESRHPMLSMGAEDNYCSSSHHEYQESTMRRMIHDYQEFLYQSTRMNSTRNSIIEDSFQNNCAMPYLRSAFSSSHQHMIGTDGRIKNLAASSKRKPRYG